MNPDEKHETAQELLTKLRNDIYTRHRVDRVNAQSWADLHRAVLDMLEKDGLRVRELDHNVWVAAVDHARNRIVHWTLEMLTR